MAFDTRLTDLLGSPLGGLAVLRHHRSLRESSWDRSGKNADFVPIEPGETKTLAKIDGPGCIRHIWFTISCPDRHYLRKLVLRMFWDGEKSPSVEVPVGDFFGVGHARLNHYVSLPMNITKGPGVSVGGGAGMNCFFPMPFGDGALITVENESTDRVNAFYYYIDYHAYEEELPNVGRFHAFWNRNARPKAQKTDVNLDGKHNHVIVDAKGRGHYVGCVLNVHSFTTVPYAWFGEGDDMIFVDGEKWPPSLHGTGTEDYFCEAWGFPSGEYAGPYHGVSLGKDTTTYLGMWSLYRWHIEDPVAFTKSIRVTIEHGHANDRDDEFCSVGYWYQTEPHKPFPKLPPVEDRLPLEDIKIVPKRRED